jgi:hypothetical protein
VWRKRRQLNTVRHGTAERLLGTAKTHLGLVPPAERGCSRERQFNRHHFADEIFPTLIESDRLARLIEELVVDSAPLTRERRTINIECQLEGKGPSHGAITDRLKAYYLHRAARALDRKRRFYLGDEVPGYLPGRLEHEIPLDRIDTDTSDDRALGCRQRLQEPRELSPVEHRSHYPRSTGLLVTLTPEPDIPQHRAIPRPNVRDRGTVHGPQRNFTSIHRHRPIVRRHREIDRQCHVVIVRARLQTHRSNIEVCRERSLPERQSPGLRLGPPRRHLYVDGRYRTTHDPTVTGTYGNLGEE